MSTTETSPSSLIDVQARSPGVALSLSRVGVTGVEKVIRLRHNGSEQLFSAQFECVVELGPNQRGVHMSRFEEVVNGAFVSARQVSPETGEAPTTHTSLQAWLAGAS